MKDEPNRQVAPKVRELEQKLGFDQIKTRIEEGCIGEVARQMVARMRFLKQYDPIVRQQEQVAECMKLIAEGIPLPEGNYFDLEPIVAQLEIEDFVLMPEQWSQLSRCLKTIDLMVRALRKTQHAFPRLFEICDRVALPAEIFFSLDKVFDDEGQVKDAASPELNRIRKSRIDEQARLRRKLDSALKSAMAQGFIGNDVSITMRNGRMVIPVLAEYKRRVKGFVHDESATGQTVFIEPEEALEANNIIREMHFAEQREIMRILTELTVAIRPMRQLIGQANQFLGTIDFIRAKARLGIRLKATFPAHHAHAGFRWFEARHPLLYLAHQKNHKPVVPLQIWLTAQKRLLVVSGPNAGGKSIALKTVGLLQYMWQSGVPVPVGEGSEMGLFDGILADIGDQQSIENDLSTYSSHLANMKTMLAKADEKTLILLDEFGTGTDPALGGPIAEAILEALCHKKVYGVVNTHYTNLKNFANRHPLVENASMKFDGERMEPLFQMEIGQPGSSYALEIAEKIGLPKPVLNQAKNKIGIKKINVDRLIADLDEEKRKWEARNTELGIRERKTKHLLAENEKLKKDLDNQRKKIVNEAKAKAQKLLDEANRRIEETIRTIKEGQAEKTTTRDARLELERFKEKLEPEVLEISELPSAKEGKAMEQKIEVVQGEVQPGDFVRIKGTESIGKMLGYKGKDAEVLIGELKTNIKKSRLEKISGYLPNPSSSPRPTGSLNLNEKMMQFRTELDIRGMRADEALDTVESWLDEAILLGQKELRILHGKGDGILRTQVRNRLKKYRQVGHMQDEHADRGGHGVTLVSLDI